MTLEQWTIQTDIPMGPHPLPLECAPIPELAPLLTPTELKALLPATAESVRTVLTAREAIGAALLDAPESKLLVAVGPCSIHSPDAAMEYACWLAEQRKQFGGRLELVMRLYFEKPRTTVGWKGLIYDPYLNETYDMNMGLLVARKLQCEITNIGVPIITEFLDTTTARYTSGLVSWGTIGARTTESQLHRELSSSLTLPIGFKNGTDGNIKIATDAIISASHSHRFPGIAQDGRAAIITSHGNAHCHIILRGSSSGTNYDTASIAAASEQLAKARLIPRVLVDCSHGNSSKDYRRQGIVARDVASQIRAGSRSILGVMLESNIMEGQQPFVSGGYHDPRISITDACIGLDETEHIFRSLYEARDRVQ